MKEFNWQQVQEIFDAAVALEGKRRKEFLDRIGTENKILQSEVLSLLSADELREVMPNSTATFFEADAAAAAPFESAKKKMQNELIGESLGARYLVLKNIGSGGMGDVYLAQDTNLMNREVVVKLLRHDALDNKEIVRKFRQEVEALARIKDEGIVTIYDFGTHGEQPFLVLEYVEGEDLSKIISPVLFSVNDFLAPDETAHKLRQGRTAEMLYLWEKLSPETRDFLKNGDSASTGLQLRNEFNRLLTEWSLYDGVVLNFDKLSPKTRKLFEEREDDARTTAFNRSLLEDLFPNEIVRGDKKRLTDGQIADIFSQLGVSLSQGHRKGIIHRDLKPANIMLTQSEGRGARVKLIDFGVARVRESLVAPTTDLKITFGTQNYMAPEQLSGDSKLTSAIDIYALGLIAYEMLGGKSPFAGKTAIAQYYMQEREEIESLGNLRPDLSEEAVRTIHRALAFKPENRFSSAAEFGQTLFAALSKPKNSSRSASEATLPLQPVQPPANYSVSDLPIANVHKEERKSGGGRGLKVLTGGALLLLAMLGVGYWIWSREDSKTGDSGNSSVSKTTAPAATKVNRTLSYKLVVQKYYEGKPFQPPFEATGDEIFGDGWRFKMWMRSPQEGFLYLLTEGANEKGAPSLAMLFPHPQKNDGKSSVKANEAVETNQMEFDKNQGTEKFWIVWSKNPVDELESVAAYVNPKDLGVIKDAQKEKAARDVLAKYGAKENLSETNEQTDGNSRFKKLQSASEVLVKMAEFRHN